MQVSKEKKSRDPLSRAATLLKERSVATWLPLRAPHHGTEPHMHGTGSALREDGRTRSQQGGAGAREEVLEGPGLPFHDPLPQFLHL